MNDVNENTHFPESPEMLNQEIVKWKQRVQEKEGEAGAVTQMEQILNDKVN